MFIIVALLFAHSWGASQASTPTSVFPRFGDNFERDDGAHPRALRASSTSPLRTSVPHFALSDVTLEIHDDSSELNEDDFTKLGNIFIEVFNDESGPYKEDTPLAEAIEIFRGFANTDGTKVGVLKYTSADDKSEIIGFLVTYTMENENQKHQKAFKILGDAKKYIDADENCEQIYVAEVGVMKKWQGKRLSSMMMHLLIDQNPEANFHLTTSFDPKLNAAALALYQGKGFRIVGLGEPEKVRTATRFLMTRIPQ